MNINVTVDMIAKMSGNHLIAVTAANEVGIDDDNLTHEAIIAWCDSILASKVVPAGTVDIFGEVQTRESAAAEADRNIRTANEVLYICEMLGLYHRV